MVSLLLAELKKNVIKPAGEIIDFFIIKFPQITDTFYFIKRYNKRRYILIYAWSEDVLNLPIQ